MKTTLYPANKRHQADYGWLKTNYTFSFGNYRDPQRMHFGALRVLNDDWIAPGEGFDKHPHENMEIITLPFSGGVLHQDSLGNKGVITPGEIQVMSAGSGVLHSEHNASKDEPLTLFQIWIYPNQKDVAPRFDQIKIADLAMQNEFYQIISPNPDEQGIWIHQQAWFHLGDLTATTRLTYTLKDPASGVFIQVIEGEVMIKDSNSTGYKSAPAKASNSATVYTLGTRDAIGISEVSSIVVEAKSDARVLVMEVPMVW